MNILYIICCLKASNHKSKKHRNSDQCNVIFVDPEYKFAVENPIDRFKPHIHKTKKCEFFYKFLLIQHQINFIHKKNYDSGISEILYNYETFLSAFSSNKSPCYAIFESIKKEEIYKSFFYMSGESNLENCILFFKWLTNYYIKFYYESLDEIYLCHLLWYVLRGKIHGKTEKLVHKENYIIHILNDDILTTKYIFNYRKHIFLRHEKISSEKIIITELNLNKKYSFIYLDINNFIAFFWPYSLLNVENHFLRFTNYYLDIKCLINIENMKLLTNICAIEVNLRSDINGDILQKRFLYLIKYYEIFSSYLGNIDRKFAESNIMSEIRLNEITVTPPFFGSRKIE